MLENKKKFVFGVVAMICITIISINLKFSEEGVVKLVGMIVGLFLASQTVTDIKKKV